MIQCAKAARNKVVKLVVDGKQKKLTNDYAIVTLSFLVPSETVSKTWVGRPHTTSAELNAATQQPFLQALVNTESEDNVLHVFNAAHDLGQSIETWTCATKSCKSIRILRKESKRLEGKRFQRHELVTTMRTCDVHPTTS